MRTLVSSLLLCMALALPAAAQTNLAGTWQGRLEVAPGRILAIHFVIEAKPDGGYSAVVTSPDEGAIRNVPAKSVTFKDDKLTIDVPDLSGGYAGTLRNGVLEGEWSQEGSKLPLSLRPYAAPTLTKAEVDALLGEWFGRLQAGGLEVTIVLHFNTAAGGALQAALDVPEQGVKGMPTKDIALDDGYFSVEVPMARAKVTGAFKADQIEGQWHQLGNSFPLTLKKGKYVPTPRYLDLPAAAREQIKGRWSGTLNGLAVIIRFETDAQGRMLGYFDSIQQNAFNIQIHEAQLADKKLTFGVIYGAKFAGELAGDKLTGEWTQAGFPKPLPLTLTREK